MIKKQPYKLSNLRETVRQYIKEALANKFGQGGDIKAAEGVANSQWGSVYNVMPKGEAKNEVFYRVQLHNSGGPVKYLKQDSLGRWYFMEPPALNWRPVNPAKVPQTTSEECKDCGCGDPNNTHDEIPEPMDGNTADVHTMDTANVDESIYPPGFIDTFKKAQKAVDDLGGGALYAIPKHHAIQRYRKLLAQKRKWLDHFADTGEGNFSDSGEKLKKETSLNEAINYKSSSAEIAAAYKLWKDTNPYDVKSKGPVHAFVAGYNAGLASNKSQKIKEETSSGAVFSGEGPAIQTPYAFSKKGDGSKKAMAATKKTGYQPVKKEY